MSASPRSHLLSAVMQGGQRSAPAREVDDGYGCGSFKPRSVDQSRHSWLLFGGFFCSVLFYLAILSSSDTIINMHGFCFFNLHNHHRRRR